jgi:hypothetical protein
MGAGFYLTIWYKRNTKRLGGVGLFRCGHDLFENHNMKEAVILWTIQSITGDILEPHSGGL